MLRTFDQAGYYETRLILMAVSLAIAGYFLYYKRDHRFLLMFASGSFLTVIAEYLLQLNGLRGAGYSLSLFGLTVPRMVGPVVQGVIDGGACGMIAFWFADLRASKSKQKQWLPLIGICGLVLLLSFVAGAVSRLRPVSSVRPMFATQIILIITTIIFFSLVIAWRKDALSAMANFYAGLLLFAILNYQPLHLMGARYIGLHSGLQIVPASMPVQVTMTLLSHLFEVAGGRLHFFIIPFAFGIIGLREKDEGKKRERYSTQHLHDLAQRGWRKRSKPFQRGN